jgi:hypothetical protein
MKIGQKKMSNFMIATMIAINPDSINQTQGEISDPLDGIDIDTEYKLIQKKSSNLSKATREMVVFRYEAIIEAKNRKDEPSKEE